MVDIDKLKASIARVKEITGKTEATTTTSTTTETTIETTTVAPEEPETH